MAGLQNLNSPFVPIGAGQLFYPKDRNKTDNGHSVFVDQGRHRAQSRSRGVRKADVERQSSCAALGGRMRGSAMRWLSIEIDPGLPAVLGPIFLQGRHLVLGHNAEATQCKDGRSHRDTSRSLYQGFVTARAQCRGRHGLQVPRLSNPLQHVIQMITQYDDLHP